MFLTWQNQAVFSSSSAPQSSDPAAKAGGGKPGDFSEGAGADSFSACIQEFQNLHETDTGDFKRRALSRLNRLQENLQQQQQRAPDPPQEPSKPESRPRLSETNRRLQSALLEELKAFLVCAEIYKPQAPAAAGATSDEEAGEDVDRARAAAVEELREEFLSRLREIRQKFENSPL